MSEAGVQTIRKAHAVQLVTVLQSEYSFWWRKPEEAILPTLVGLVLFLTVHLGKGFLTGTMNSNTKLADNDFSKISPRFTPKAMNANLAVV